MRPILILGPMDCEIDLLEKATDNAETTLVGGFRFTKGSLSGREVVLCRCLIGMVNSAAATVLAAERFGVGSVIIQGTAGAHDPDLRPGDIVLGESIVEIGNHHTLSRGVGEGIDQRGWIYQGEEINCPSGGERTKVLHSDEEFMRVAMTLDNPHGRLVSGTIGSADIWNRETDRILYLHKTLGTHCEEMEGFAVGQVCANFGLPFIDIRVISNSELHPGESFNESFAAISQEFTMAFLKALR